MNTTHSATGADRLNTANLTAGQQLVMTITDASRWGDTVRKVVVKHLTVTKILKTRLVCTDEDGREYRFIVEYSAAWPSRNGQVSTDLEGSRGGSVWNVPRAYKELWTTDDPGLVEHVATVDAENKKVEAKREARAALEAFKSSLTVDNADAAIEALQAWKALQ